MQSGWHGAPSRTGFREFDHCVADPRFRVPHDSVRVTHQVLLAGSKRVLDEIKKSGCARDDEIWSQAPESLWNCALCFGHGVSPSSKIDWS